MESIMSDSLHPIAMALLQANEENRLVAYSRDDQGADSFCCGWFLRFDDECAVFLDVPADVFGGQEVMVDLSSIEWITIDSPYLRGLEQLWLVGSPPNPVPSRAYTEFEYIETVVKEAWENGQVVSAQYKYGSSEVRVQVLDLEGDIVCLQELSDDDASSQGARWCRIQDLICIEKDTVQCLKMESLLGLPRRATQVVER